MDISDLLRRFEMYKSNSCTVCISNNLDNVGQIIWTSRNATQIFGANEVDLKMSNINNFMPTIFGSRHNNILRD